MPYVPLSYAIAHNAIGYALIASCVQRCNAPTIVLRSLYPVTRFQVFRSDRKMLRNAQLVTIRTDPLGLKPSTVPDCQLMRVLAVASWLLSVGCYAYGIQWRVSYRHSVKAITAYI